MTFDLQGQWMHYECVLGQSTTWLCGDSLAGCRLTGGVALIGVNATGTQKAGQTGNTLKHCENTQKTPRSARDKSHSWGSKSVQQLFLVNTVERRSHQQNTSSAITTHTCRSEAKQCRYMWISHSRHRRSWCVDFSTAVSFRSTAVKNSVYLYRNNCQGKLCLSGHKKTMKRTNASASLSMKNLRITERWYSFFSPLQIADVKASCYHGGKPGGFIVITVLFPWSWCPYDCVTAQKISQMNNQLHGYSLKVQTLNIDLEEMFFFSTLSNQISQGTVALFDVL